MREQRHRLIFIDETGTTTKMTRLGDVPVDVEIRSEVGVALLEP